MIVYKTFKINLEEVNIAKAPKNFSEFYRKSKNLISAQMYKDRLKMTATELFSVLLK